MRYKREKSVDKFGNGGRGEIRDASIMVLLNRGRRNGGRTPSFSFLFICNVSFWDNRGIVYTGRIEILA